MKRELGLILAFIGVVIILSSVVNITGNVISDYSIEKSFTTIIGLVFVVVGLVLFEFTVERKNLGTIVNEPIESGFVRLLNKKFPYKLKGKIKIFIDTNAIKYLHEKKKKNPELIERIEDLFGSYESIIIPRVYNESVYLGSKNNPLIPREGFGDFIRNGTKIYTNQDQMEEEIGYNPKKQYERIVLDEWKITPKGRLGDPDKFVKTADFELLKIALHRGLFENSTIIITDDQDIIKTAERLNDETLDSSQGKIGIISPSELLIE